VDEHRARELLAQERARIERELAELGGEKETDVEDDPADVAADLTRVETDEAVAETFHDQLAAIDRAEQRLTEGTYGRSVQSGEPIPDARLEAIPWAELTAEEEAAAAG
jgi:DnaK suppressor protein